MHHRCPGSESSEEVMKVASGLPTCQYSYPRQNGPKPRRYNAARNIALALLRNYNGGEGGAPVGMRVNGGAMTASGDYIALSISR